MLFSFDSDPESDDEKIPTKKQTKRKSETPVKKPTKQTKKVKIDLKEEEYDEEDFDDFNFLGDDVVDDSKKDQFWKPSMEKTPSLSMIQKLVDQLSSTCSSNEKKEILLKHIDSIKILYYTSNPFFQFHVKSVRVRKMMDNADNYTVTDNPENIFELLDMLRTRKIVGNRALHTVCRFVQMNKKYESLIYSIIDKKLKTRAKGNTINRVFPGLVPVFAVARGFDIHEVPENYINYKIDTWFASRKFDGVRLICIIRDGIPEFRSREGNPFSTLQVLEKTIKSCRFTGTIVLDGELCIFDENKENFKQAVSEIRRKSGMIQNPRFCVFDMLTLEEFESGTSTRKYSERLEKLKEILSATSHEPFMTLVEQVVVKDEIHIKQLTESAFKKEWEGLILRRDFIYQGKKSNNMVKIKKFTDEEFPCVAISKSMQRRVIDGKDVEMEVLKNITVDIGGGKDVNLVDVGTGFSLDERIKFSDNPDLIVGHVVTVAYSEKSQDCNGKPSLRFPVFKAVYGKSHRKL
jgi:DNA ligase-1